MVRPRTWSWDPPHTSTSKSDIPVVGIDYFFITKGGVVNNEDSDAEVMEEKLSKAKQ